MKKLVPVRQLDYGCLMQVIYGLIHPATGKIKYVGRSSSPAQRRRFHMHQAKKGSSIPVHRWIQELSTIRLQPTLVILQEVCRCPIEAERYWIKRYRGDLLNIYDGGNPEAAKAIQQRSLANMRKNKRPVMDIISKSTFPSVSSAARAIGVTSSYLVTRMANRIVTRGRYMVYLDSPLPTIEDFTYYKPRAKAIVCLNTGQMFRSITAASKAVKVNHSSLRDALRTHTKCSGMYWCYAGDYASLDEFLKRHPPFVRPIQCVTTGEIFHTAAAAARKIDRTYTAVLQSIKLNRNCAGLKFKYA